MNEYILSQFLKGAFDELVILKNKDYYTTMEMVKTNIRANDIKVEVEHLEDRTLVRRVK